MSVVVGFLVDKTARGARAFKPPYWKLYAVFVSELMNPRGWVIFFSIYQVIILGGREFKKSLMLLLNSRMEDNGREKMRKI